MIENLIGQWVGDLRGTDIGNVFAVITDEDGRKRAEVTVNVGGQITKLAGYAVEENGVVSAELASEQADRPPGSPPSAKIIFDSVAAQGLTARWTTSTGHAGVLSLVRWETTPKSNKPSAVEASAPIVPPKPIEIVAREGRLANLTLYRAELEIIVAKMLSLAGGSNDVVINATIDGRQIRQFSKDFFARNDLPQYVSNINLSLNDGRQPIQSVIVVNLSDRIESTFFVQSDNAIWVSGSYSELEDLFRRYTNPVFVFIQKHGLNANGIMLLVAIALLPDLPLLSRFVVLGLTFVVVNALLYLHRRMTSTKIYLDNELVRGCFSKVWPSLISAITAAAILGFVA